MHGVRFNQIRRFTRLPIYQIQGRLELHIWPFGSAHFLIAIWPLGTFHSGRSKVRTQGREQRLRGGEGSPRGAKPSEFIFLRTCSSCRSRRELSNGGIETSVDPNLTPVWPVQSFLVSASSRYSRFWNRAGSVRIQFYPVPEPLRFGFLLVPVPSGSGSARFQNRASSGTVLQTEPRFPVLGTVSGFPVSCGHEKLSALRFFCFSFS